MTKRSVARWAIVVLLCATLVACSIGLVSCFENLRHAGECWAEGSDLPSLPNAPRLARVTAQECNNPIYLVTLRDAGQAPDKGHEVFRAWNAPQPVLWKDKTHLIIIVAGTDIPLKSLQSDGNTTIIYRVPSLWTEEKFRLSQEERERRHNECLAEHRCWPDAIEFRKWIQRDWAQYHKFRVWMDENNAEFAIE